MFSSSLAIPQNSYARIAGSLYLLIAVFGMFSIGYVPSIILEAGDAAATASNLLANQGLFRMGIVGDVIVMLVEIILTVMLYVLFKPVSPTLSLIAAWSRLAMILVMGINILLNILPLILLADEAFLSGFALADKQAVALLLFDAHSFGIYVWQLFFAVHLLAIGYMISKSDLFPKVLGWVMGLGAFGYFLQGLSAITFTENATLSIIVIALLVLVTLGELAFAFWLLFRGVKSAD